MDQRLLKCIFHVISSARGLGALYRTKCDSSLMLMLDLSFNLITNWLGQLEPMWPSFQLIHGNNMACNHNGLSFSKTFTLGHINCHQLPCED